MDTNIDNVEQEEQAFLDPNDQAVGGIEITDQQKQMDGNNMDEDMMDEGDEEMKEDSDEEDFVDESVQGFFEHTDSVYCVNMNPARNELAVTGGGDDVAYIWNITNGEKIHQLKGHKDSVSSVQFNFDGSLVATGGMDALVKIWDTASGAFLRDLEGPSESVEFMEWHPKGNIIVAGSTDCCAFMWSTLKGDLLGTFVGHTAALTCGGFTPDGKKVVTCSEDTSLRIWNPKDSSCLFTISGHGFHESAVTCIDFRKDSAVAITGGDDHFACISNLNTGKVLGRLEGHTDSIVSVTMSKTNPNLCMTGSTDGAIIIWDLTTFKQRSVLRHKHAISKLKSHPTDPVLFSSSVDKTICVWDERNGQLIKQFRGHTDSVLDFDITNNHKIVSVSDDKVSLVFSLLPPQ
ncbi:hypothetical protein CYY_008461 [Polysphondylium violaceum]|uniref:WD40 repeat-containing protein n=1 Tax=Polysphondylium violaceum TaxID=133409 RepID=A0A8J4PLN5_9MYCE|nr:hypothetical protein CYY_008461 [Polysphondylium violaceum]